MPATIVYRDPADLKNHLTSIEIYGTGDPGPEMVESVKTLGIISPLLITATDHVLSGHRRRQCAIIAKLKSVPCVVTDETDPDAIDRLVIEANRQRVKTNEQLAREAQRLLVIAEREAAKRKDATLAKPGEQVGRKECAPVRTPKKPAENAEKHRATDDVAAQLNVSPRTVEAMKETADAIDRAEAAGDVEAAEEIRTTLNERGAKPAAAIARKAAAVADDEMQDSEGQSVPAKLRPAFVAVKELRSLAARLGAIRNEVDELLDGPAGAFIPKADLYLKLQDAKHLLTWGLPYAVCPKCDGKAAKNCVPCRASGFVNKDAWKVATK